MYSIYPVGAVSDLLMLLAMGSALHLCICSAGVLFKDFVTVMKHHDKKQLMEERVYSPIIYGTQGRSSGQELGGRN